MKTRIDCHKWHLPAIALILTGQVLFAGCSLVGAGGGLAIDSANGKKADRIHSESQKIVLRYSGGQIVSGYYRGLEYLPIHTPPPLPVSDSLPNDRQLLFPRIGEQISVSLHDDTTARKGTFSGLAKTKYEYLIMLEPGPDQPLQNIPIRDLYGITTESGRTLTAFPDPGRMNLLYEVNGEFRRVPLQGVSHINYRSTNHVLILGALGLLVDVVMAIQIEKSIDTSIER